MLPFSKRTFAWLSATGLLTVASLLPALAEDASPGKSTAQTVRLRIDYGNGVEKHYTFPWKEGLTSFDALKAAEAARPAITFKFDKSGGNDTIIIKEIDGFTNEGSGGSRKNWQFWINTGFADRSCGVLEMKPSDVATWRFDVWKPGELKKEE